MSDLSIASPDISLSVAGATAAELPSALPQAVDGAGVCLNCDTALTGAFCADCGQGARQGRLTMAHVGSELMTQVLSLDGTLVRTMVEMTTRPGGLIADYLQGRRRRYLGPLAYLFFGTAVWLLLSNLYEAQMVTWVHETVTSRQSTMNAVFSPAQLAAYQVWTMRVAREITYSMLAMSLGFAAMLRLLFRRTGINLAESLVFALYTFAHAGLIYGVLSTALVLGAHLSFGMTMQLSYVIYAVFCAWAAAGVFGSPVRSSLKAIVALLVSYMAYGLVTGIGLVLAIYLTVPR